MAGKVLPKTESKFLKVKCPDCQSEQITFNRATIKVHCQVCGATLSEPSGGVAILKGEVVGEPLN
jgi:small subunit ribosomal protein S27e